MNGYARGLDGNGSSYVQEVRRVGLGRPAPRHGSSRDSSRAGPHAATVECPSQRRHVGASGANAGQHALSPFPQALANQAPGWRRRLPPSSWARYRAGCSMVTEAVRT